MPADPQSTALLAHVVAQTKANIDFLVSQNFILASDAASVLSRLSTLESGADAASNPVLSAAERMHQLTLTDGDSLREMPPRPQSPPKAVMMPARRNVPPPRPAPRVQRARALWDYNENGSDINDLSFRAGDTIEIVSETNADWWTGRLHGRQGLFPANYVEKLDSSASADAPPPIPVPEPSLRAVSPGGGGGFYGRRSAAPSPVPSYAPVYSPLPGPPIGAYGPPAWAPQPGPPQPYGGYEKQQPVYAPPPGPLVQQAPPPPPPQQPEKKSRFGGLGNTMANSAAGGLGFGAGAAVGSGIIDAIF